MDRSVQDRIALYHEAPVLSGPPTWGGIQKVCAAKGLRAGGGILVFGVVYWIGWPGVTWLVLSVVMGLVWFGVAVRITRTWDRDFFDVMKESRAFEQYEESLIDRSAP